VKHKIFNRTDIESSYFLINQKGRVVWFHAEGLKKLGVLNMQPYLGQPVAELVPFRYANSFDLLVDHCFSGEAIIFKRNFRLKGIEEMIIQLALTPVCISDQVSHILINLSWDKGSGFPGDLSFLTSHQLRAPLTNILSLSDLLTHPSLKTFNYSKIRDLLSDINDQARELDNIVLKLNSIINQDLSTTGFKSKSVKPAINHIMLVDDDPMVNRLHQMLLSKYADKKIVTFTDPLEALAYLEENLPDLLFLDLNMPLISGFEFLEKLHQRSRFIDVIIVSSSIDASEKIRASTYDFVKDFLSKPLTYEKIEKILV
jgi:CheY-like chemotaxis protein